MFVSTNLRIAKLNTFHLKLKMINMKLLTICMLFLLVTGSISSTFSQEKVKIKDGKMKSKGEIVASNNTVLPYTAVYSSDFSIGNPKYAAIVLDLWKDFENNNLMGHDYMSDTVKVTMADGTTMSGKKQVFDGVSAYRNSLGTVKDVIYSWVPLHSIDKNADLVGIWGSETITSSDGKSNTSELHEVWFFNKDGKVSQMIQWTAKPAPNM